MSYEEFKTELYYYLSCQAKELGLQTKLLEERPVNMDEDSMRFVRLINLYRRETDSLSVHEDVICVTWGKRNAPVNMMYWQIPALYERFQKEGWQGILPEITSRMHRLKTSVRLPFDSSTYEGARGKLILRPLHYGRHREELEDCFYWRYGSDVALVLYALLQEQGDDLMTMRITRRMAESWQASGEIIMTNALLSTAFRMPPRIYHANDIRWDYHPSEGIFMSGEQGRPTRFHVDDRLEGIRGYRLTTTRWLNGAVALFYPGVQERLASILQEDYYVGFTSIHEAVIHPVRHKSLTDMRAAIRHTNAVFDERDMLTNQVFRYVRAKRELVEL